MSSEKAEPHVEKSLRTRFKTEPQLLGFTLSGLLKHSSTCPVILKDYTIGLILMQTTYLNFSPISVTFGAMEYEETIPNWSNVHVPRIRRSMQNMVEQWAAQARESNHPLPTGAVVMINDEELHMVCVGVVEFKNEPGKSRCTTICPPEKTADLNYLMEHYFRVTEELREDQSEVIYICDDSSLKRFEGLTQRSVLQINNSHFLISHPNEIAQEFFVIEKAPAGY
jgi:hypothetical protein